VVQDDAKFDRTTEAPDGAYIWGLYIEGCRWDAEQGTLEESQPKVLFTKMPFIWMKPDKTEDIVEKHSYTCPVYKTLERFGTLSTTGHSTNYVLDLELPSDRPEDEWIRAGVACFLALKY
jgi:dynein heavy chain